jgi:hypothetical protein
MIYPVRDFNLALVLLISGVDAVVWGHPAIFDESVHKARHAAVAIGALAAIIGFFATLIFAAALRIQRRLERGEDVIASWTMSPILMQQFAEAEARARNPLSHWRPRSRERDDGMRVIFAPEAVLIGRRLFSTPSAGMQSIRSVRVQPGVPSVIEFQTQIYVVVTRGNSERLAPSKGLLRVPAPSKAEAEGVGRFYQEIIDGVRIVAPRRWSRRIVGGRIVAATSVPTFIAGIALGKATGFSVGKFGPLPDLLILAGVFGFFGGLIVSHVASRFHATQHERR